MKIKCIAVFALLAVAIGVLPGLALAGTTNHGGLQPFVGHDVGAPPPPMPIGPGSINDVGAPPPPMPIGPLGIRDVGAPPPPMPIQ